MKRFRIDNTEGFNQNDLDIMNSLYENRISDNMEKSELDYVAERVQIEYEHAMKFKNRRS